MAEVREVMTWDGFGEAARQIAKEVHQSGFDPEIIVSVARGGLLPAGAIAYALDQKSMLVMNVEFYTGVGATLLDPRLVDPVPDNAGLEGKRVLIVDDVADSGRTLQFVKELCEGYAAEVKIAVLYEKPRSIVKCEYIWKTTDKWIAFPWSDKPPVTGTENIDN